MICVRTRNMRSKLGNWAFVILLMWLCSIYATYLYASNRQIVKNDSVSMFLNREIKMAQPVEYTYQKKVATYDKNMPLIFIGGMPRSGTTLMRAMLDAHPDVRCGQETRIIPRILGMRANWLKSPKERVRLEEAGVSKEVINDAITQFILEVIVKHGHPAQRLCNKDPFTLKSINYLKELFPNSKFILMLRDGRATAHSIISRQVTISGFDITSYRDVLTKWNRAIETMYVQCNEVGLSVCLPVHYEQLVLQPVNEMHRILSFLGVSWNPVVLNHEKHISNISLSNLEKSTDQVQRALYLDALTSWFGHIPDDVERDMAHIAPMLHHLGYDPNNRRPSYGQPDEWVLNKVAAELNTKRSPERNNTTTKRNFLSKFRPDVPLAH